MMYRLGTDVTKAQWQPIVAAGAFGGQQPRQHLLDRIKEFMRSTPSTVAFIPLIKRIHHEFGLWCDVQR